MFNFGDIVTDTVVAALLSALATIIGAYYIFRSKKVMPAAQQTALDSETMKRYDDLMNQQLIREQELRDQMAAGEQRHSKEMSDLKVDHAAQMAKMVDRIQILEDAVTGEYELKIEFQTMPDPRVKSAEIKLLGKRHAISDPDLTDPGTPSTPC